jgi:uncharacterized repeat protein (TIGR01451 family)
VTNNGGAMLAPYPYEIRDSANTLVASGTIQLAAGGSTTINYAGTPGETYTLTIRDTSNTVVATSTANCTPTTATPTATSTPSAPSLSITGSCNAGAVSFIVTNNGGPMPTPYNYEIRDSSNTVVATGTIQLGAGASQTINYAGTIGQTYTLNIFNPSNVVVATSTTTCGTLGVTGVCSGNGVVTFTVTNSGAAMPTPYSYEIRDSANTLVASGTIQLGAGASQPITYNGTPGQTYTFTILNGPTVVTRATASCGTLSATGSCAAAGAVSFTVTNSGGAMGSPYSYEIRDASNVTVATGTILLGAGASQTINYTGSVGQTYTLRVLNGEQLITSATATCIAATGTPGVIIVDPAISKYGDPTLALPGEIVTFTLTATNRGNAPAQNVMVEDQIPSPYLIPISASTTKGTYTITGNDVLFSIGTLNPGETVTMKIVTRVSPNAPVPATVTNTGILTYTGGTRRTASTSIRLTSGSLPATGEHPDNRFPIELLGAAVLVGGAAFLFVRRRTLRQRTR